MQKTVQELEEWKLSKGPRQSREILDLMKSALALFSKQPIKPEDLNRKGIFFTEDYFHLALDQANRPYLKDSSILRKDDLGTLGGFFSYKLKLQEDHFRLLYRGSRDGFCAGNY